MLYICRQHHFLLGELPLSVVRLICLIHSRGGFVSLRMDDGAALLLPLNIGDLDPAITELDLKNCSLTGVRHHAV